MPECICLARDNASENAGNEASRQEVDASASVGNPALVGDGFTRHDSMPLMEAAVATPPGSRVVVEYIIN
jgi:hypothetical protein